MLSVAGPASPVGTSEDVAELRAELVAGKHHGPATAKASESDVGTDPDHLPVRAAARMRLAQCHTVSRLDLQVLAGLSLAGVAHWLSLKELISSRSFLAARLAASAKSPPDDA